MARTRPSPIQHSPCTPAVTANASRLLPHHTAATNPRHARHAPELRNGLIFSTNNAVTKAGEEGRSQPAPKAAPVAGVEHKARARPTAPWPPEMKFHTDHATTPWPTRTRGPYRSHADQSQPTFENAEQQASSSGDQSPPDHPRAAGPPTVPDPQRQTRPQLNATSSLSTSNSTHPQPITRLRHNFERDPAEPVAPDADRILGEREGHHE